MPWQHFIVRLSEELAWPLATITIVLIMRKPLTRLLSSLSEFRFGDVRASFRTDLENASEDLQAAKIQESEDSPAVSPPDPRNVQLLTELNKVAAESPTSAILLAWDEVESLARQIIDEHPESIKWTPRRPYFSIQRFLFSHNVLPQTELSVFRDLRKMRNQASNATDKEISIALARHYVRLALDWCQTVKRHLRHNHS